MAAKKETAPAKKEKIEKLTPEQEAKMVDYREKGLAWGLNTDPADRPRAEAAIARIYSQAKMDKPEFYWVNSPHEALALLRKESKDEKATLNMPFSGQHEAGWVAWWKYFKEVLGVEIDARAEDWADICQSCGWWYAYAGAVICLERYEEIHRDEQGRLHREDGHAVRYRNDAGGEFFWHGQNVPAKVIMAPETLTVEEIQKETNAEVQRIMVERYGPGKFMQDTGCKLLDMDGGLGVDGSAPRGLWEDNTKQKWLVGTDGSTARVYYMAVPNEARTAKEAHMLISGLKSEAEVQFEA
jgi:hypothetical protein